MIGSSTWPRACSSRLTGSTPKRRISLTDSMTDSVQILSRPKDTSPAATSSLSRRAVTGSSANASINPDGPAPEGTMAGSSGP